MPKIKQTTATTLVLELLRRDERLFLSAKQIREKLPQLNGNQISAALYSLLKYHAVDFVAESDETLFWFARRPEDDTRYRVVEERTPESKPRKRRAPRKLS